MMKFLLAVPVALALGSIAIPAHAGPFDGIAAGEPYPGYEPYPRKHPQPMPDYYEDEEDEKITCWEGKRIIRDRNFYRVRPMKCEGAVYRYQAFKNGRPWVVRVNSYSARIVSARPLRAY